MNTGRDKIDLACGQNKKEGFFGIDIVGVEGVDLVHDLTIYPWPVEDLSVEEIYCAHYVEHIPHENIKNILASSETFEEFKEKASGYETDGFIKFMNEVTRILKPGGKITIHAPYYMSVRAFGDPTHRRYIGDFSFYYFSKDWRDQNNLSHYGIDGDYDVMFSYVINNELALKSTEVRENAFKYDWNAIDDIIVELKKK